MSLGKSNFIGRSNTVQSQDILQGDDTFEFVNVGAANHRKSVHLERAHAFESQAESMVGVKMREVYSIEKLLQLLRLGVGCCGLLQFPET